MPAGPSAAGPRSGVEAAEQHRRRAARRRDMAGRRGALAAAPTIDRDRGRGADPVPEIGRCAHEMVHPARLCDDLAWLRPRGKHDAKQRPLRKGPRARRPERKAGESRSGLSLFDLEAERHCALYDALICRVLAAVAPGAARACRRGSRAHRPGGRCELGTPGRAPWPWRTSRRSGTAKSEPENRTARGPAPGA